MIYLDYQATTPLAPEVAAAMRPWIESHFGNPHSPHRIGREAAAAIEVARGRVIMALSSSPVRFERSREAPSSGARVVASAALGTGPRLRSDGTGSGYRASTSGL